MITYGSDPGRMLVTENLRPVYALQFEIDSNFYLWIFFAQLLLTQYSDTPSQPLVKLAAEHEAHRQ